jgi:hypothetical protein
MAADVTAVGEVGVRKLVIHTPHEFRSIGCVAAVPLHGKAPQDV